MPTPTETTTQESESRKICSTEQTLKSVPLPPYQEVPTENTHCSTLPLLSVNIISAKHDLENVYQTIKSLPKNCEVIIVANEQHDGNDEIHVSDFITDAEKRRVTIVNYKYKLFSFAKARNIAIEHSRGQWILAIDSDEILFAPDGWEQELKHVPCGVGAFALGQVGASINTWKSLEEQGYYSVETVRLFRRMDEIRWVGYAHEQIKPSIDKLKLSILKSEYLLVHFGYQFSKENCIKKLERNTSLLFRQLAENPLEHREFFLKILHRDLSMLIKENYGNDNRWG